MRKHDLSFLNKYIRKEDFFKNFFADLFEYQNFKDLDIPSKGGVYIFVSKEQKFIYPKGESRVIYIGESSNLRRRLYEHKSKYQSIKNDKKYHEKWWDYNRYFYMIEFGCDIYFITRKGPQDEKNLESDILGFFYERYRALPVGNSALSIRR